MVTVKRYTPTAITDWNTWIASSMNGTFLLNRRFMDYHQDRFIDHSLLFFENKKLIAVFPANEKGTTIFSHGGLTYGGLIVGAKTSLLTTLACFYALTKYCHDHKFTHIFYKPVPSFFHTSPYHQDGYALFLLNAKLSVMNTGFVASPPATISDRRMRMVRKAQKNHIKIIKAPSARDFFVKVLTPHLSEKFGTKPVHTIEEIEALQKKFPANILQYEAYIKGKLVAGATIFFDRNVAHSQYIASSKIGRDTGALDYLFWHLFTHEFTKARYFSLGTTNMGSPDGKALARGLVEWKEGFDTIMYPYTCYDIQTKNYRLLAPYL